MASQTKASPAGAATVSQGFMEFSQIKKDGLAYQQKYAQYYQSSPVQGLPQEAVAQLQSLMNRSHALFMSTRENALRYSADAIPQEVEEMGVSAARIRELLKQESPDVITEAFRDLLVKVSDQYAMAKGLMPIPVAPLRRPPPPPPPRRPPPPPPPARTELPAACLAESHFEDDDDNDSPPDYPPPPPPIA